MTFSLSRTFERVPFDAERLSAALTSAANTVVGSPCGVEVTASVTRPSGLRETLTSSSSKVLFSLMNGSDQFVESDWWSTGNDHLYVDWLPVLFVQVGADTELGLERTFDALVSDLALVSIQLGLNVSGQHLADPLAAALRARNEALWARWVQAGRDLGDEGRLSYHGPVHDMRDVLAGVLRAAASDEAVRSEPWFIQDPAANGVTQAQRARYALTHTRGRGSAATQVASDAVAAIAGLARSVYSRGSAAHVAAEREEALQIRRYVAAVLCDVLNVTGLH